MSCSAQVLVECSMASTQPLTMRMTWVPHLRYFPQAPAKALKRTNRNPAWERMVPSGRDVDKGLVSLV